MKVKDRYQYYWSDTIIEIERIYPEKKPLFVRVNYLDGDKEPCEHSIEHFEKLIKAGNITKI